jgi:hypothetical protein
VEGEVAHSYLREIRTTRTKREVNLTQHAIPLNWLIYKKKRSRKGLKRNPEDMVTSYPFATVRFRIRTKTCRKRRKRKRKVRSKRGRGRLGKLTKETKGVPGRERMPEWRVPGTNGKELTAPI